MGHEKILEVSTKSDNKLGWQLSAFNLMVDFDIDKKISLECAFQGSKVFEGNVKYEDLYHVESIQAKKDERLKKSGNIIGFEFEGTFWDNEPKTAFYDYLYIKTLYNNYRDIIDELTQFEAFSDIEFNPKKSVNCQARTCAILVSLVNLDLLESALNSKEDFINTVYKKIPTQLSLF
jgi:cobyric acid synthase